MIKDSYVHTPDEVIGAFRNRLYMLRASNKIDRYTIPDGLFTYQKTTDLRLSTTNIKCEIDVCLDHDNLILYQVDRQAEYTAVLNYPIAPNSEVMVWDNRAILVGV